MRYIYLIIIYLTIVSCNKDDNSDINVIKANGSGVFLDIRDNNEYGWIRIGDLEWMTENLRYTDIDEYGYSENNHRVYYGAELTSVEQNDEINSNKKEFGYLYDYDAALKMVPEGWRIPTDNDWKKLEAALGMTKNELEKTGWRGDKEAVQIKGNKSNLGLNLKYGGIINFWDNRFVAINLNIYGFYWSSTKDNSKPQTSAYYRAVGYYENNICRKTTLQKKMMSIRCVRDTSKN